jgi:hypothetical protein
MRRRASSPPRLPCSPQTGGGGGGARRVSVPRGRQPHEPFFRIALPPYWGRKGPTTPRALLATPALRTGVNNII